MRFERALMLAKFVGDQTQERRATRGLAAAARLQARTPARACGEPGLRCHLNYSSLGVATRESRLCRKSPWGCNPAALSAREAAPLLATPCTTPCPAPQAPCPLPQALSHAPRQGQHRTAIQHLQRVLEISGAMGDHVGDADAYGTIADIYTEIGHFERAAEFYDKYIERMSADGPV